jgi:predicted helicase
MIRSRFATFLETFDPEARHRGRQWEEACQWFLRTDHLYRTLFAKVWLWKDWPGRWGPGAGIDLVAKAKNGTLWAIQAKAYAPSTAVTKHDVDTFLSESARSAFSHRLLIATTSRVARAARQAIAAQEKPVIVLLRHDLNESSRQLHRRR